MSNSRTDRVADLLRGELNSIFLTELNDPRARLVTVSNLEVTRDLAYATVYLSSLQSEDDQREESLEAIQRASGYIRRTLARRVDLRRVPELRFQLYQGAEHSQRITELLEDLPPVQLGQLPQTGERIGN